MYYKRKLENTILEYLDKKEILAIVGPRQSGKTTLLKKIQIGLKNSVFLNFEDKEVLELFETDIKNFAKKYFNNYKYILHNQKINNNITIINIFLLMNFNIPRMAAKI